MTVIHTHLGDYKYEIKETIAKKRVKAIKSHIKHI